MINLHESYVAKLRFKLVAPGSVVRHTWSVLLSQGFRQVEINVKKVLGSIVEPVVEEEEEEEEDDSEAEEINIDVDTVEFNLCSSAEGITKV